MTTSPIPRLQADLHAAEDHVERVSAILLDAERVRDECAADLARATAEHRAAGTFEQMTAIGAAYAAELLAEKADDRRRETELDDLAFADTLRGAM